MYDYLIVGAGLYGAVFANEKRKQGKKCLVIDERNHIAGNAYTENIFGIEVHRYGAHIFHTDSKEAWEYVNTYAEFNRYTNSPVARYKDEVYNLPFNMNTFHALWGVKTPAEAKERIEAEIEEAAKEIEKNGGDRQNPANLEEQALLLGGRDIYEKLVKGYTEKQWGREARELPSFIIKRLPFRFIYDNNYFNDLYQGIPIGGYTGMVERILDGTEVRLGVEFSKVKNDILEECGKGCEVVYTGSIDRYFEYTLGNLEYRSLEFRTEVLSQDDFQGNAVVNYTEYEVPYTRIIEHKYFEEFGSLPRKARENTTVITREYPANWTLGMDSYYPINDDKNNALYKEYEELAKDQRNVHFGGRLGKYKYYDMDDVILEAIKDSKE
ncbi:MAG: UDP-galactopyranose mutase [Lachnospiraceae bacterium]|nr:UDP-galactopyranose mutase [Lachnospiraceae bacterium]